jgi:hypothetical protein
MSEQDITARVAETVARLRAKSAVGPGNRIVHMTMDEAADLLEALKARLAEVEAMRDAVIEARDMLGNWWATEKARAEAAEAARDRLAARLAEARGKMHDIMCLPEDANIGIARAWASQAYALLTPADAASALSRLLAEARVAALEEVALMAEEGRLSLVSDHCAAQVRALKGATS